MPSVERLKERLDRTLRAKKLDAALDTLRLLAALEPGEARWVRRAAHLERVCAERAAAGASPDALHAAFANVPVFGELAPEALETLVGHIDPVELRGGDVLFREGDPADRLYVVVDGAVVPIAEGLRRRKLAVLESGAFFGEIGLFARQPRNATIEALVDSRLVAIDRSSVQSLIRAHPTVKQGIARFLRDRLIDRQLRTNLFFASFVDRERREVARQFRFVELAAGTTLVEAGRPAGGLHVVLSGRLEVVPSGLGGAGAEIGAGDVFGGLSLIDGQPVPGHVVARDRCRLVVLGERRFRKILGANPRLDRVLRRLATESPGRGARSSLVAF